MTNETPVSPVEMLHQIVGNEETPDVVIDLAQNSVAKLLLVDIPYAVHAASLPTTLEYGEDDDQTKGVRNIFDGAMERVTSDNPNAVSATVIDVMAAIADELDRGIKRVTFGSGKVDRTAYRELTGAHAAMCAALEQIVPAEDSGA